MIPPEEKIKEAFEYNYILVRKLRAIAPHLSRDQIEQILQAITETCPYCWDNTPPCYCEVDR